MINIITHSSDQTLYVHHDKVEITTLFRFVVLVQYMYRDGHLWISIFWRNSHYHTIGSL